MKKQPSEHLDITLSSADDARVTDMVMLGGGEGFATYKARFEGKAAFLVDCGSMNGMLDDDDQIAEPVRVMVFATEEARDKYVEDMRQRSPGAIGILLEPIATEAER